MVLVHQDSGNTGVSSFSGSSGNTGVSGSKRFMGNTGLVVQAVQGS
jgi:preprotein translocase subunit SecG